MENAKTIRRKQANCLTCRERKLKCSGEKPQCRTCINSGRRCRGYKLQQPTVAVSQDASQQQEARLLVPVSSRHTLRQQMLSLYLQEEVPDELGAGANRERNWLLLIPDLEIISPALQAAIEAVCAGRLAQQRGSRELSQKSLVFYNTSLRELQSAINHPVQQSSDQTLAACLALTMYEFTESPEKRAGGYFAHYNGAMTLLRHRGPEAHATGFGHSLLMGLRMHSIFNCFERRSLNFMSDKDWMDLPWSSQTKDAHVRLLDIMLKIPRILPDPVNMDNKPSYKDMLDAFIRRVRVCWRLDSALTDWLERLTADTSGPLFWPEVPEKIRIGPEFEANSLYPSTYNFPSFGLAQSFLLYWLTRMIVCYQLGNVYRKLEDLVASIPVDLQVDAKCTCQKNRKASITPCLLHFALTQLPPLGFRSKWSEAGARHICQSVAYFLQERLRSSGPACLIAPLMVLRWHWEHDYTGTDRKRELGWLGSTLFTIYTRGNKINKLA
ncbi:hypothetical protein GQ53DRAFT_721843 [Thozetella sp. PMI_491]|nr:hypothetical protein GQ53DRAFT_721843 [Thozetella sp. PMI_491]